MSESLPITNEPTPNTKEEPKSPKLMIAILTAITTLGVSFIGVMPQLRSGDTKEIIELRKQLGDITKKAEAAVPPPAQPGKKQTIEGRAMSLDGKQALNGIEVYLVPAGTLLTATTVEDGSFNFNEIPAGTYSIFLRDSTQGKSGRYLLDATKHELDFKWVGARVNYHITPSP